MAIVTYPYLHMKEMALAAECYETPVDTADNVLDVELLTPIVIDPCCGRGVLSKCALARGYKVFSIDKYDWGYGKTNTNFLTSKVFEGKNLSNATIFMNPPFSIATDFVARAFELDVRKIVCFQRFAWWEAGVREEFWRKYPPNRVYACRKRATCWRVDIDPELRGIPKDKGGAGSGTTTAHAWFIWERGQPQATVLGHI